MSPWSRTPPPRLQFVGGVFWITWALGSAPMFAYGAVEFAQVRIISIILGLLIVGLSILMGVFQLRSALKRLGSQPDPPTPQHLFVLAAACFLAVMALIVSGYIVSLYLMWRFGRPASE